MTTQNNKKSNQINKNKTGGQKPIIPGTNGNDLKDQTDSTGKLNNGGSSKRRPNGGGSQNRGNKRKPQFKTGNAKTNMNNGDDLIAHTNDSGLPDFLRDNAHTRTCDPVQFQSKATSNLQLICRTVIEHLKFSPLGEEGSMIRSAIIYMLNEAKTIITTSNASFSFIKPLPLSVSKADEYVEMTTSFILCYEFLTDRKSVV